jgi:hypothetical protein
VPRLLLRAPQPSVGVLGAQCPLVYSAGALVERLGLGVAALSAIERGEVVEGRGDVGVLGPQRFLEDDKRALGERLGLRTRQLARAWGT